MKALHVINLAITICFLALGTLSGVRMIEGLLSHEWGISAIEFLIVVACVYLAVADPQNYKG